MRRQHSLQRAAAAAVLIIAILVPAVRADDEIPYEDPSARMGRPPGFTEDTSTETQPPAITDSRTAERPSPTRTVRDVRAGAPTSLWTTFLSWLEQQALRITGQGRT